ncbi:uridine kinase [Lactobacillus delbrueckii subsp. bulgaricus]
MSKKQHPIIIGIAGGSGSGKTTIAHELYDQFKTDRIRIITEDSYYKNHPEMSMAERNKINFDHPDAFDTELLISQLQDLLNGKAIEMPIYDFTTHLRNPETVHVEPADIIILEGILVLASEELRNLMDIKIFVDTDDDIRLIRRQRRDMAERGRSFDSIIDQYLATVKPSYHQFVEPSKRYANIIVPEGGANDVALDMLITKVRDILRRNDLAEKEAE